MILLLQESDTSRIVEQHNIIGWIIARQRLHIFFFVKYWKTTAYLYSNQCETLEDYIKHFNWQESRTPIGKNKQHL